MLLIKIGTLEGSVAHGTDLSDNDEYTGLLEEQKGIDERLQKVADISANITSVQESLDDQEAVLASDAYQRAASREQYLSMFSTKTLLADIKSAMDARKKEVY